MSQLRSRWLLVVSLLALITCSRSDSTAPTDASTAPARVAQTRGGAVVLSRDERVAVACNRSASVVTVFSLDPNAPADQVYRSKKELALGPDWEPWAAVIGADDDTAYVISRRKQVLFRILDLHTNPTRDDPLRDVAVGSEPTGIAISPSGARVFVANWGEGTISVVTTYDFRARDALDLNGSLASTGLLGAVPGRAALAHPRALAMTDDGDTDDGDETLFATEFFSQPMLQPAHSPVAPPPPTGPAACFALMPDAAASCARSCLCTLCPDAAAKCFLASACATLIDCAIDTRCEGLETCGSCLEGSAQLPPEATAATDCENYCLANCLHPRETDGGPDADAASDAPAFPPGDAGRPDVQAGAPSTNLLPSDLVDLDKNRVGIVYSIRLGAGTVDRPIFIQPVADTGFYDAPNLALPPEQRRPTACFPNQLYAAAVDGDRLYVTSMCASPAGPLGPAKATDGSNSPANFKTVMHPVVFAIDTQSHVEVPDERVVLTQKLESNYADDGATERRFPLIPNDVTVSRRSSGDPNRKIYLTALGADAVFGISPDANDGSPGGNGVVGAPGARFIDLHPRTFRAGQSPIGIAVSQRAEAPFAVVVNDVTQNLSVIDLATSSVQGVEFSTEQIPYAKDLRDSDANAGRRLFSTGLDSWSFQGEAWVSCEGCHPDGLSDGVTWFFTRGPRRTISTAGTYDAAGHRRMMLWTGNIDEIHDIEAIVRGVAGGSGVILWDYPLDVPTNDLRILYDGSAVPKGTKADPRPTSVLLNNLNGSLASIIQDRFCPRDADHCDSTLVREWNKVDAYMRTVRAPRAPTYLDRDMVEAGKRVFAAANCAGCHGGPSFTLSKVFYTPGPENNGTLPYFAPPPGTVLDATLLGQLRTVTYEVPSSVAQLNPAAKSGPAPLRRWSPGSLDPIKYAYDTGTAAADQINCVLRDVGTFPAQGLSGLQVYGVVPRPTANAPANGAPPVLELRQDMKTLGVGETGFNIPSLVGVAAGAPYFHAGNARTLEEAFDEVFQKHHQALAPDALAASDHRAADLAALVAYLLSIDDFTAAPTAVNLGFDPDFCAHTATPVK